MTYQDILKEQANGVEWFAEMAYNGVARVAYVVRRTPKQIVLKWARIGTTFRVDAETLLEVGDRRRHVQPITAEQAKAWLDEKEAKDREWAERQAVRDALEATPEYKAARHISCHIENLGADGLMQLGMDRLNQIKQLIGL